MASDEIIKLGKKALAKKRRREERDAKFLVVATRFIELVQEALDAGEDCSIVVWGYRDVVDGELFHVTKCNPCGDARKIVGKRLGITFEQRMAMKLVDRPTALSASFRSSESDGIKHIQCWPFVSAWEAKIINRVGKDRLKVPVDCTLGFFFMDVRSVSGLRMVGPTT